MWPNWKYLQILTHLPLTSLKMRKTWTYLSLCKQAVQCQHHYHPVKIQIVTQYWTKWRTSLKNPREKWTCTIFASKLGNYAKIIWLAFGNKSKLTTLFLPKFGECFFLLIFIILILGLSKFFKIDWNIIWILCIDSSEPNKYSRCVY